MPRSCARTADRLLSLAMVLLQHACPCEVHTAWHCNHLCALRGNTHDGVAGPPWSATTTASRVHRPRGALGAVGRCSRCDRCGCRCGRARAHSKVPGGMGGWFAGDGFFVRWCRIHPWLVARHVLRHPQYARSVRVRGVGPRRGDSLRSDRVDCRVEPPTFASLTTSVGRGSRVSGRYSLPMRCFVIMWLIGLVAGCRRWYRFSASGWSIRRCNSPPAPRSPPHRISAPGSVSVHHR